MYTIKSDHFKMYQGIYENSREFPLESLEQIPARLHKALDDGNAAFFAELEEDLPRLYRRLVHDSSPVYLLERVWESETLDGDTETRRLYRWGLECAGTPVLMGIPAFSSVDLNRELSAPYFAALPTALHGFYVRMDGMAIPVGELSGPPGHDLPAPFNNWDSLTRFQENLELPRRKITKILKAFGGDDLRILVRGSRGDLIILNFTRKDRKLYHVKDHDFDHYGEIVDVPRVLDEYFENAVLGFPRDVDLRRGGSSPGRSKSKRSRHE